MSPPRSWLVVEARLPTDVPDDGRLAEALLALGGRAVQEDDGWLVTHLPVPEDQAAGTDLHDAAALTRRLEALSGLSDLELRLHRQPHQDWAELWKRGLAPRRVGEHFVVTPSWCDPGSDPGDRVLVLDPGMAFGNAEHGTTRGCLRLLEKTVRPGQTILDVGTGSGVLAIAAARLDAAEVTALESDAWAVEPARENIERNGVGDRVRLQHRQVDVPTLLALGPRDGIVANIEAGVLTPLLSGFAGALRPGGWLILSGILEAQLAPLAEAARAVSLRLDEVDADGEWRSARFHVERASDVDEGVPP
jgi:ribosomal protein L11 methyltransferase